MNPLALGKLMKVAGFVLPVLAGLSAGVLLSCAYLWWQHGRSSDSLLCLGITLLAALILHSAFGFVRRWASRLNWRGLVGKGNGQLLTWALYAIGLVAGVFGAFALQGR